MGLLKVGEKMSKVMQKIHEFYQELIPTKIIISDEVIRVSSTNRNFKNNFLLDHLAPIRLKARKNVFL